MNYLYELLGAVLLPIFMVRFRTYWSLRCYCLRDGGCFARAAHKRYLLIHNASIPLEAVFKGEPVFPHGIDGVFVSKGAVIGSGAVIFQQVTIGSNTLMDAGIRRGEACEVKAAKSNTLMDAGIRRGSPVVGDNCYVGAGAKIIGKIVVGNNVRVGANAVVYADVPDNSVAVNSPTRVINKSALDNRFKWFDET